MAEVSAIRQYINAVFETVARIDAKDPESIGFITRDEQMQAYLALRDAGHTGYSPKVMSWFGYQTLSGGYNLETVKTFVDAMDDQVVYNSLVYYLTDGQRGEAKKCEYLLIPQYTDFGVVSQEDFLAAHSSYSKDDYDRAMEAVSAAARAGEPMTTYSACLMSAAEKAYQSGQVLKHLATMAPGE